MKKKIKYSTNDFSPSFLPQNRKEVFKDVYKMRFTLILKCGLMLLLFAIPLIATIVALDVCRFGTAGYTEKQLEAFYFYWHVFLRIGVIISLYVLLIGVSGIFRVIKLLIWQEGIDFWYDFKLGVKENYKQMAIASAFLTIVYVLYFVTFYVFIKSWIAYVILGVICILFVPLFLWYLALVNIYKADKKDYLSNSMFFYGKTIGWTLAGVLFLVWPFFFEYFQIPFTLLVAILKPIILILLLLFYYPCLIIILELYSNHHFDKWINDDTYPEFYRKGLFNSETFIDEEEDLY